MSRGSDDFRRRGIAAVVRTCVPATLVSQVALKASRMVILPWVRGMSKLAPPLLMRMSNRP